MASITNLGIDMNPIANPLTSGRMSNAMAIGTGFSKPKDPSKLTVPEPAMTYADALMAGIAAQEKLKVPNTAGPMKVDYSNATGGISQKDVDYWNNASKKTAELINNMDAKQKELLAHIEDFVGKSRLELDESKKKEEKNGN